MMNPEQTVESTREVQACPERLGTLALQGNNEAVRRLLTFARIISENGISITCEQHERSHMLPASVFVFDRQGLL